ncbi:MAG: glycosyltransferase family 39 protein, partial [bacterium]|nr:glycosyltransferase family 39 protein [bacterium]
MEKRNKLFLGAIIVLAIFLRMWTLTENPPHLNWDEVSHGYNAYSILSTGKDEWGKSWPTIFRAYGDFKLPVYIYLTALSEKFFGLSEFAVRFPSAMAGVLTIIALYFFVVKLFDKKTGLLAAFILTVSPWHILLSRPAIEGNLALCFIVFGAWAIILSRNKPFFLVLAAAFFGLSLHTYNSARVFVPLLAVFLGITFRKELKERLKPLL